MRVLMLGVNHRTAPVELREKLALVGDDAERAVTDLHERFPEAEFVVLSTCNRTELYTARAAHGEPTIEQLRVLLAQLCRVDPAELTAASIHREQQPAIHHLFRVCTGLDSMVIGETQVLGQVKRAYEAAANLDAVGPVLHRLFQDAIRTARQVRRATGIDKGRVSVGSVAADMTRQVFESFEDKCIVGIGAGEIAKTALRHLRNLQPKHMWLVNRSPQRALELCELLRLSPPAHGARHIDELDPLLVEADVLLCAAASREPIITVERFKPLLRRRHNRPLFLIDLGVPRNIEPAVGTLANVYLYDIDDLQSVVAANMDQRQGVVEDCELRIAAAVDACMLQIQNRDLGRLIRQLRHRLQEIGHAEQMRTLRKLANTGSLSDPDALAGALDEHTHRLINKILHLPLTQLDHRNPDAPLGFYAAALRRLFDLQDSDPEPVQESMRDEQAARPRSTV